MKFIFLIVLFVFYLCFLGKAFILGKKGVKVNVMFKSKFEDKYQKFTLFTGFFSAVFAVLSIIFDWSFFDLFLLKLIGLLLSICGTLVFIKAVYDMKTSWRVGVNPDEKTELVTNGIYSISRNPAYLGFILLFVGVFIGYMNLISLVVFLLYFISLDKQVKIEEEFLEMSFSEEYIQYKNKVKRYI